MADIMDIRKTLIILIIFLMSIIPFSMICSSRKEIINNKIEQIESAQNNYSSTIQQYFVSKNKTNKPKNKN